MTQKDQTNTHMQTPQVGDLFKAYESFRMQVAEVAPNGSVAVEEWSDDSPRRRRAFHSMLAFQRHYESGVGHGYWIQLMENQDVSQA